MKRFIGLILVCSALVTSAIAEEALHPDPHRVLSRGKILVLRDITAGYTKGNILLVSYNSTIYRCKFIDEDNYNSYIECRRATAITE